MTIAQNPLVLWLMLTAALAGLVFGFLREELRTRAMVYGGFLLACGVALWPPFERAAKPGKIRLGLDLKGGTHLVLKVVTDDALKATVDDSVQAVRDKLTRAGITFTRVEPKEAARSFAIEGAETVRVKDVRDLLEEYRRNGWDLREPSDGRFEVRMTDATAKTLKDRTVEEEIRTLERRVNVLGVTEPVIGEYGSSGDQILIQLPGVTDVEEAKRILRRTAQLSLKLVEDSAPSKEALLQNFQGKVPDLMEVATGPEEHGSGTVYYLVRREAVVTGRDLKQNARAGVDPQTNEPEVEFSLTAQGSERFGRATEQNVGRRLAIILDNSIVSAPTIQSRITENGVIHGHFSAQEADELAKVLRAGALPASLQFQQELTVGASLGRDSIRAGITATLAGMAFLFVFMIVYYRLSGVNAIVALTANLLILLGLMAYFAATLTLPGIAGIILTIGVGVDTNVLVFERIREELRNGKTVRAAISNGFDRVLITIVDTHMTALIAAAFLFQFGTGPIKGFAVTLFGGLVANVFASFFVSKFLFEWVLGKRQVATLSIGNGLEILTNPVYDFLGKTKFLMSLSLVIILTGVFYIRAHGVRYGVEFQGGTQLIVKFTSTPAIDKVRSAADTVMAGSVIQSYDRPEGHQVLIRLPEVAKEGAAEISGPAQSVLKALATSYSENPVLESSSEIVGPSVGADLRQKAIYLTLCGLAGQLFYIGWRFRGAIWGTAATLAVFHDVLITVGLLAILRYEFTLNVIAALLTLVGYSVNDTIVIFDRVRENLKQKRKDPLDKIINDSVNQTLSRTLISSGTTFLTVLGLFLFGGEVLRGFGFTMVVGIVVGTYSTIYIASPIVVWWQGLLKRGAPSAEVVSKAR